MGSDLEAAIASAQRMQELGRRFRDDTLVALGVFFEGRALVKQARVREGLALLDEAMLAALSDQLQPMWTGAIYCGLLDACHELVDLRRAREWTDATRRWCDPLPVASLYPGICRVHWAGILQVRGAWEQAEAEALRACADMAEIDVFAVADGYYEVGEVRRRRGDLAGAEDAYTRAHEVGRDPQPGLALLRLAQGRADAALSSIAAALAASTGSRLERAPLHAAQVATALAAGDVALARASADEVAETAATFDSVGLRAEACRSQGAVALAEGQAVVALAALREAVTAWNELDAPYETARTRVLLAEAYRALDDADAAARECAAARAGFERLGATADLRALDESPAPPCGLTAREVEVLQLVAQGQSNREIATALVVSEKTVARHLSNIFTKLDVPSRAAATAYAFSNGLVSPVASPSP
jgi:ATP/maltotriose-dependent transcriptional regulator MalT